MWSNECSVERRRGKLVEWVFRTTVTSNVENPAYSKFPCVSISDRRSIREGFNGNEDLTPSVTRDGMKMSCS